MSLSCLIKKNKKRKSLPEKSSSERICKEMRKVKEAPGCTCQKGSMTLEAAIIVPFLTCLFVFLLFFFRIMQVQLFVQDALEKTGRQLAVYAFFTEGRKAGESAEKPTDAQYLIAAKGLFMAQAEETDIIKKFVIGGKFGISFWESEFEGDFIRLRVKYYMKFPVKLLGNKRFLIVQDSSYRKWTGWKNGTQQDTEEIWVYVADTGTVYHKNSSCTYLNLSIKSVDAKKIADYRNEGGQKYKKCERCAEKENKFQKVYITNYGDRYHTDLNCSGIKRTVEMIRLSETGGRSACSKCWK